MSDLPTTAIGTLGLLCQTSTQIDVFSDQVIQSVKQGEESPLKVLIMLKAFEKASERILKEIKDNYLTESEKHPGTTFEFQGNQLTKADTYVKYDYGACGDTVWERLHSDTETAKVAQGEREAFLKTLKAPLTLVDDLTGEVVTIHPPKVTRIPGIKVSIR